MSCKYCSNSKISAYEYLNMSKEDIEKLTKSDIKNLDGNAKSELAENPRTPTGILKILAVDADWLTLKHLLKNKNTPSDILLSFFETKDLSLKEYIAKHPNIPKELQERILKEGNTTLKLALAENPYIDMSIVKELIQDKNAKVILNLISKNNLPFNLIIKLIPRLELYSQSEQRVISIAIINHARYTKQLDKLLKLDLPDKFPLLFKHQLEDYYKHLIKTEELVSLKKGLIEKHHKDNIRNTDGVDEQYFKALNIAKYLEEVAEETDILFKKIYYAVKEKEKEEIEDHGVNSKEVRNLREAIRVADENDVELTNRYKVPELKDKKEFIEKVLTRNYTLLIKKTYIGLNILINAAHTSGTVIGHIDYLPVINKALKLYRNQEISHYLKELSNLGSRFVYPNEPNEPENLDKPETIRKVKRKEQLDEELLFINKAKQEARNMLSKKN